MMNPDEHGESLEETPEVVEAETPDADDAPDPPKEPPAHDPEIESEARFLGWKPETEWKGDKPPGFIADPQEFLNRWENVTPVKRLRERAEKAEREFTEKFRKLESVSEAAMARLKADHERQLEDVRAKRREAVESGDTEAYDRWDKAERDMLKSAPAEPTVEQPQGPDPVLVSYRDANDWAKDPVLWAEAVQSVNFGLQAGAVPPNDTDAQLKFAEAQMRRKYPHMFQPAQQRPTTPRVDGGGLGGAGRRSGFSNLPSEAKSAFKRFVSEGLYEDNDKGRQEFFDEYERA